MPTEPVRTRLSIRAEPAEHFELVQLGCSVDRAPLAVLPPSDEVTCFDGPLAPGEHAVLVEAVYARKGEGSRTRVTRREAFVPDPEGAPHLVAHLAEAHETTIPIDPPGPPQQREVMRLAWERQDVRAAPRWVPVLQPGAP